MHRRFLIADDSPAIRRTIQEALELDGIPSEQIRVVDNGDDAIEGFTRFQPDLVFLDVQMPGVDAYDAAQAMLLEDPEVRIVVVTGLSRDHPRVEELISYGVFDVLHKPVRYEDIRQAVKAADIEQPGLGRIP